MEESIKQFLENFKFEYVLYVIYAILAIIMIINIIRGFAQGSRKGIYNVIMTAVFWLAYFLVMQLVPTRDIFQSSGLYEFAVNLGLPTDSLVVPAGATVTNFVDYLLYLLAPLIKENTGDMALDILADPETAASAADFILCTGDAVLKFLCLIPVVIAHKILKAVIYNLFVAKLCETSKKKVKKLKKKNERFEKMNDRYYHDHRKDKPEYVREIKKNEKQIERIEKNRARLVVTKPLGLLMGAIRGFIAVFIMMSFINALAFTVPVFPVDPGSGATAGIVLYEEGSGTGSGGEIKQYTSEEKGQAVYRLLQALSTPDQDLTVIADYIGKYQNSLAGQCTRIPFGDTTLDKIFVDAIFSGTSTTTNAETGEATKLTLRKDFEGIIDGLCTGIAVLDDRDATIWTKIADMVSGGEMINFYELFTTGRAVELAPVVTNLFDTSLVKNFLPIVMETVRSIEITDDIAIADFLDPSLSTAAQWKIEINNLFEIVDQITNNGTEPIKGFGEGMFDYKKLTRIDTANIVNSNMLSYYVTNMLVQGSVGEGLFGDVLKDFVLVPDEYAVKDENGKYSTKWNGSDGELKILFDVVKSLVLEIDDFEHITDSVPNLIKALDGLEFGNSEVLRCSLTKILEGDLLGDIVELPDEAYDKADTAKVKVGGEDKYIFKKDEITKAIHGIAQILTDDMTEFDFTKIKLGKIEDAVDDLLGSKIIHATISKLLKDNLGDTLVIKKNLDNGTYIDGAELKSAIKGMVAIVGGNTAIGDIALDDIGSILDNTAALKTAFDSSIVRATLSKLLADSGIIEIPADVKTDITTTKNESTFEITKAELCNLVDGYAALEHKVNEGKPEAEKVKGLDLFDMDNLTFGNLADTTVINALLDSKIVRGTITGFLSDYSANVVLDKDLYDSTGTYIDDNELKLLLTSAKNLLGENTAVTQLASLDVNTVLDKPTELKEALGSKIFVDTLSMYLSDISSIEIPDSVKSTITDINNNSQTVINKAELECVIDAFVTIKESINRGKAPSEQISGIDVFSSFDFDVLTSLANEDIDVLCDSEIISYNAYVKIMEQNGNVLGGMIEMDEALEGDNLADLIKSFKVIYSDSAIKNALEGGGLTAGTSLVPFKGKEFINALTTGSEVLCDSLPNILEKFTSALSSADTLDIPHKTEANADTWTEYWGGDGSDSETTGYKTGELYKLLDGIDAFNNAATEAAKGISADKAKLEEYKATAQKSDIISASVDFSIIDVAIDLL